MSISKAERAEENDMAQDLYNLTITTESATGTDNRTHRNITQEEDYRLRATEKQMAPRGATVTMKSTKVN